MRRGDFVYSSISLAVGKGVTRREEVRKEGREEGREEERRGRGQGGRGGGERERLTDRQKEKP